MMLYLYNFTPPCIFLSICFVYFFLIFLLYLNFFVHFYSILPIFTFSDSPPFFLPTDFYINFSNSKTDNILLFLIYRYAMIIPLTEILSVKNTGSFTGLRNSLKITRYNTTTVFAWIVLKNSSFFRILIFKRRS